VRPRFSLAAACLWAGLSAGPAAVLAVHPAPALAQQRPAPAKPARDPAKEKAAPYLKTGLRAANAGQWDDAYAELSIAWKLYQDWETAAALGRAALRTQHHAEAIARLSYYLREAPPAKVSARQRADAEKWILEAKGKTGALTITAAPGAEIAIDGEVVGTAPLPEPVHADPGRHRVEARQGGAAEGKDVDVAAGSSAEVSLVPVKAPDAAPEPVGAAASTGMGSAPRIAVLAGGGALAVGGVVAGAVSLAMAADRGAARQEASKDPNGRAAAEAAALAEADARNAALWSFVGGGLAAAGTAAFFLATRPGSKAPVKGAVGVGPAGPSVWIQGEF
jgi:hypothetical protein